MSGKCPVQHGSSSEANDTLPPAVPGLPILGNTLQLLRKPAHFFAEAYAKYGPVFRVKLFGKRYIILAGQEAFNFFLDVREKHFTRKVFYSRFAFELGTKQFILGESAELHQDLRRKMRLGYSRELASAYLPQMIEAAQRAVDLIPEGKSVSVMKFMAAVSFEQYGYVLCDRSLSALFGDAYRYSQFIMKVGTKVWPEFILSLPRYRRAKKKVFAFMHELVEEKRGPSPEKGGRFSIMDALLAAKRDDGDPVAECDVVATALYGFIGTIVYMNRGISFLLYHLMRDSALRNRVMEEVDAMFAHGPPDIKALRGLTLLRAAFKESLRFHPIALALPFFVEEDFEFGGYRVRKGEHVALSGTPGHFSERFYKCPYVFDAQRGLPPRNEYRPRGAHVPFGFSTRVCPASGLVEVITLCTVATMLYRRKMEMDPPDHQLKTTFNPLPGPSSGFRIKFGELREARKLARPLPGVDDGAVAALLAIDHAQEVEQIITRAIPREYQPGQVIIKQGDLADAFFMISEGTVDVVQEDAANGGELLATLEAGEYFGEAGLLGEGLRTATCLASGTSPVRTLVLGREDFLEMIEASDLVSDEIAAITRRRFVANKLKEATPHADLRQLTQLLTDVQRRRFAPGETIIRQGDRAETFYVVLEGSVEVLEERPDGTLRSLAQLSCGQFFGETGILQAQPRNATVRAGDGTPVEVLEISRAAFLDLVERSPAARNDIVSAMCQGVMNAMQTQAAPAANA